MYLMQSLHGTFSHRYYYLHLYVLPAVTISMLVTYKLLVHVYSFNEVPRN